MRKLRPAYAAQETYFAPIQVNTSVPSSALKGGTEAEAGLDAKKTLAALYS
jgi:hypothetical protein